MNYNEAVKYVTQETNHGIVLGLENVQTIAAELGLLKPSYKVIHITGTNGKGSTGAFIASILKCAGFKTGHFSSPAILDRRDMICINGIPITQTDYADCVEEIKKTANTVNVIPTEFEVDTLVAYLYFAKQNCDYAIVEVGMGGRLDATNFVQNTYMCVFTPISLDHNSFLGSTIEEIAHEKRGIIKTGAIIVSSDENKVIDNAIFSDGRCDYKLGMKGVNQQQNASLAILACKQIDGITDEHIKLGLEHTRLPSRFDFVNVNGRSFVIDGAHNPHAGHALAQNVSHYLNGKKINAIIGMFRDKDIDNTVSEVLPYLNSIYCIAPPTSRGLEAEILKDKIKNINSTKTVIACKCLISAIDQSKDCDITLIFGSLSLAKEFYEWSKNNG